MIRAFLIRYPNLTLTQIEQMPNKDLKIWQSLDYYIDKKKEFERLKEKCQKGL